MSHPLFVKGYFKSIPLNMLDNSDNRDINDNNIKKLLQDLLNGGKLIERPIVRFNPKIGKYKIEDGGHRVALVEWFNVLRPEHAVSDIECFVITDDEVPTEYVQEKTYSRKNPTLEEVLCRPAVHNLDILLDIHKFLIAKGFYNLLSNRSSTIIKHFGRLTTKLILYSNGQLTNKLGEIKELVSKYNEDALWSSAQQLLAVFNSIKDAPVFHNSRVNRIHYQIIAYAMSIAPMDFITKVYYSLDYLADHGHGLSRLAPAWQEQVEVASRYNREVALFVEAV